MCSGGGCLINPSGGGGGGGTTRRSVGPPDADDGQLAVFTRPPVRLARCLTEMADELLAASVLDVVTAAAAASL